MKKLYPYIAVALYMILSPLTRMLKNNYLDYLGFIDCMSLGNGVCARVWFDLLYFVLMLLLGGYTVFLLTEE